MIKTLIFPIFVWLSMFFTTDVLAGGFNLQSIGQVDTSGRQISQWWYSGSSAVMKGEATSGGTVTVSVDGVESVVTVDENGNWTYTPASLGDGDHKIILTSGGSTINFILTTGKDNVNWEAVSKDASTTALPTAGVAYPTMALLMIGVVLVVMAKKLA